MKTALQEHIYRNLPFLNDKKLLIAISGGIDSVVLTHLLHKLNFDISLAHCNFLLREKESNKDEQFVVELGEKLNTPTYTIRFETEKYALDNGISTQMAARNLRYNWFQQLASTHHFDFIITAHHKDDVLETFLINLIRGTGLNGLTGIPEINQNIVRPLLPFSQKDILVYAVKKKIIWREDKSNASIKYMRNKIRHKVIPVLKELNPSLLETFTHTIINLKGSQLIINDQIIKLKKEIVTQEKDEWHFNLEKLQQLSDPKVYLYELLKDFNFTEWNDIANLLSAQTGKQIYSKSHRLLKNRTDLILTEIKEPSENNHVEISENTKEITHPISLKFEILTLPKDTKSDKSALLNELIYNGANTITLDVDKISFPLTLRKWEKGDYFYPIGMQGKKKVSKYLKDEKKSIIEKEKTWLLCAQNEIIWVVGKRMDERFKVTSTTNNILKISLL